MEDIDEKLRAWISKAKLVGVYNQYTIVDYDMLLNKYRGHSKSPSIPPVKNINDLSFYKNSYIETIRIPEPVTRIGRDAFATCEKLKVVNIESTKLGCISDRAFEGSALESINIPDTVWKIGDRAFRRTNITEIILPENLTILGINTFCMCNSLRYVKLNDKLDTIPFGCFSGCENLDTIELNPNIDCINPQAFKDCRSLKHLSFSSNLKFIGDYAFSNCVDLEYIKIPRGCKVSNNALHLTNCEIIYT